MRILSTCADPNFSFEMNQNISFEVSKNLDNIEGFEGFI